MPILWIDKYCDSISSGETTSCQLVNLINKSTKQSPKNQRIHIIVNERNILDRLIKALEELDLSHFNNLDLRLGWIDNERVDVSHLENVIYLSEYNDFKESIEKETVKSVVFASKATTNKLPHIGFQRHFGPHIHPKSISLGELISELDNASTLIRSVKKIYVSLDVLKQSDTLSKVSPIVGMDIFDICQLIRLFGLSKNAQKLHFNLVDYTKTEGSLEVVALLIWYYLEGQIYKELETMKQRENDIFLVSSDLFDQPIKFVVGHKTGRWWYQHPISKEYLPCSERDYKAISMGNLPEAIMDLAQVVA